MESFNTPHPIGKDEPDCYCVCHSPVSSCPYCKHCKGFNEFGIAYNIDVTVPAKDIQALITEAEKRAELRGIHRGRKAETDLLRGIFQNDDNITPDEYEAVLKVLNDRLERLDKPDYERGTWTV